MFLERFAAFRSHGRIGFDAVEGDKVGGRLKMVDKGGRGPPRVVLEGAGEFVGNVVGLHLSPSSGVQDVTNCLQYLELFLPTSTHFVGGANEGGFGDEGVWGYFALARLVQVKIRVFGEGVVGEVAYGLKSFGFDLWEVLWGGAKLADVR